MSQQSQLHFFMRNQIIAHLFEIGAVKYGSFVLKSGKTSNYYFDMRLLISYPTMFAKLIDYFLLKNEDGTPSTTPEPPQSFDIRHYSHLSGIHFGGVPLANYISTRFNIPQLFVRDAPKEYGTQQQIEGIYRSNSDTPILLVDDVLTTGKSIREKLAILREHRIPVGAILVILDRRTGETDDDSPDDSIDGIPLYSILKMADIAQYMSLRSSVVSHVTPAPSVFYKNTLADRLYRISLDKKSNLVVACDLDTCDEIIALVEKIHPYIVGVKLHVDTLQDFSHSFVDKLTQYASQYNFIVIEDRKFADIGAIAIKQLGGLYQIGKWADAVTVHTITGKDQMKAIQDAYPALHLIPVVELSCRDNLISNSYVNHSVDIAFEVENVVGIVCQERAFRACRPCEILTFSPGINLTEKGDDKGQQYRNSGLMGHYWIVGRGVYKNKGDEESSAKTYRDAGWGHFLRI